MKRIRQKHWLAQPRQPPSGGCVLKRLHSIFPLSDQPAAFGRLCVETFKPCSTAAFDRPAAFGRLCVETAISSITASGKRPAAFGRLCVETSAKVVFMMKDGQPPSGGCVLKPFSINNGRGLRYQPPSGGCVLKQSSRLATLQKLPSCLRAAGC